MPLLGAVALTSAGKADRTEDLFVVDLHTSTRQTEHLHPSDGICAAVGLSCHVKAVEGYLAAPCVAPARLRSSSVGDEVGWQPSALPRDRLFAEAAQAFQETQQWAIIVDDRWQIVFLSDEFRRTFGFDLRVPTPFLGTAWTEQQLTRPFGATTPELVAAYTEPLAGLILNDIGRTAAEKQVDPRLRGVLDRVLPVDKAVLSCRFPAIGVGGQRTNASMLAFRIRDESGRLAGTAIVMGPAIGTGTVAALAMASDPDHLDRMQRVAKAARRPAAILFADLEASSPLRGGCRRRPTSV